jgi:hypothetical protein
MYILIIYLYRFFGGTVDFAVYAINLADASEEAIDHMTPKEWVINTLIQPAIWKVAEWMMLPGWRLIQPKHAYLHYIIFHTIRHRFSSDAACIEGMRPPLYKLGHGLMAPGTKLLLFGNRLNKPFSYRLFEDEE